MSEPTFEEIQAFLRVFGNNLANLAFPMRGFAVACEDAAAACQAFKEAYERKVGARGPREDRP